MPQLSPKKKSDMANLRPADKSTISGFMGINPGFRNTSSPKASRSIGGITGAGAKLVNKVYRNMGK